MWLLVVASLLGPWYPDRVEYWSETFQTESACEARREALRDSEWVRVLRSECLPWKETT